MGELLSFLTKGWTDAEAALKIVKGLGLMKGVKLEIADETPPLHTDAVGVVIRVEPGVSMFTLWRMVYESLNN